MAVIAYRDYMAKVEELERTNKKLHECLYNDSSFSVYNELHEKVATLKKELENAEIEKTPVIGLGSIVEATVTMNGKVRKNLTFVLLANPIDDIQVEFCTMKSELGRAVLNRKIGDEFSIQTADGLYIYKITNIR